MRVLFDPGSDETFIHRRAITKGATPTVSKARTMTVNGIGQITNKVEICDVILPEFSATQRFQKPVTAMVYDSESNYDLILGLNMIVPMAIDVSCSTMTIRQNNVQIPFKPAEYLKTSIINKEASCFFIEDPADEELKEFISTPRFTGSAAYSSSTAI